MFSQNQRTREEGRCIAARQTCMSTPHFNLDDSSPANEPLRLRLGIDGPLKAGTPGLADILPALCCNALESRPICRRCGAGDAARVVPIAATVNMHADNETQHLLGTSSLHGYAAAFWNNLIVGNEWRTSSASPGL